MLKVLVIFARNLTALHENVNPPEITKSTQYLIKYQ